MSEPDGDAVERAERDVRRMLEQDPAFLGRVLQNLTDASAMVLDLIGAGVSQEDAMSIVEQALIGSLDDDTPACGG